MIHMQQSVRTYAITPPHVRTYAITPPHAHIRSKATTSNTVLATML